MQVQPQSNLHPTMLSTYLLLLHLLTSSSSAEHARCALSPFSLIWFFRFSKVSVELTGLLGNSMSISSSFHFNTIQKSLAGVRPFLCLSSRTLSAYWEDKVGFHVWHDKWQLLATDQQKLQNQWKYQYLTLIRVRSQEGQGGNRGLPVLNDQNLP